MAQHEHQRLSTPFGNRKRRIDQGPTDASTLPIGTHGERAELEQRPTVLKGDVAEDDMSSYFAIFLGHK